MCSSDLLSLLCPTVEAASECFVFSLNPPSRSSFLLLSLLSPQTPHHRGLGIHQQDPAPPTTTHPSPHRPPPPAAPHRHPPPTPTALPPKPLHPALHVNPLTTSLIRELWVGGGGLGDRVGGVANPSMRKLPPFPPPSAPPPSAPPLPTLLKLLSFTIWETKTRTDVGKTRGAIKLPGDRRAGNAWASRSA